MERGEVARKKLKSDRKKRKALQDEGDNVVAGLKEAEATADKSEKERNQVNPFTLRQCVLNTMIGRHIA